MDLDKAQGPNAKKWPCFKLKPGGLKLAKGIVSSLKIVWQYHLGPLTKCKGLQSAVSIRLS